SDRPIVTHLPGLAQPLAADADDASGARSRTILAVQVCCSATRAPLATGYHNLCSRKSHALFMCGTIPLKGTHPAGLEPATLGSEVIPKVHAIKKLRAPCIGSHDR